MVADYTHQIDILVQRPVPNNPNPTLIAQPNQVLDFQLSRRQLGLQILIIQFHPIIQCPIIVQLSLQLLYCLY